MIKKQFLLPLVTAIVAAGGAFATAETGMRVNAYGENSLGQCVTGELQEPMTCSSEKSDEQCQVDINGALQPAFSDPGCDEEIFRQTEN